MDGILICVESQRSTVERRKDGTGAAINDTMTKEKRAESGWLLFFHSLHLVLLRKTNTVKEKTAQWKGEIEKYLSTTFSMTSLLAQASDMERDLINWEVIVSIRVGPCLPFLF